MERQKKSKRVKPVETKRTGAYIYLRPPVQDAVEKLMATEHRTRTNLLERLVEEALRARGVKL